MNTVGAMISLACGAAAIKVGGPGGRSNFSVLAGMFGSRKTTKAPQVAAPVIEDEFVSAGGVDGQPFVLNVVDDYEQSSGAPKAHKSGLSAMFAGIQQGQANLKAARLSSPSPTTVSAFDQALLARRRDLVGDDDEDDFGSEHLLVDDFDNAQPTVAVRPAANVSSSVKAPKATSDRAAMMASIKLGQSQLKSRVVAPIAQEEKAKVSTLDRMLSRRAELQGSDSEKSDSDSDSNDWD